MPIIEPIKIVARATPPSTDFADESSSDPSSLVPSALAVHDFLALQKGAAFLASLQPAVQKAQDPQKGQKVLFEIMENGFMEFIPTYNVIKPKVEKVGDGKWQGKFPFGPRQTPTQVGVQITHVQGGENPRYDWKIDGNGNGDFSDDPKVKVEFIPGDPEEETTDKTYAEFQFSLGRKNIRLSAFHLHESEPNVLYIRGEYGLKKTFQVEDGKGGKKVQTAYVWDFGTSGDFTWPSRSPDIAPLFLFVDFNADGKIQDNEFHSMKKPFTLGNQTYQFRSISPTGEEVMMDITPAQGPPTVPLSQPKSGEKAPILAGEVIYGAMKGRNVDLSKDFKGKVILIDFWATWCPPCIEGMPDLAALRKELGTEHFEIIAANQDNGLSARQVELRIKAIEKASNFSLSWPVLFWKEKADAVGEAWGVTGLPTYILVDGDTGKVLATPEDYPFGFSIMKRDIPDFVEKKIGAKKD